MLLGLLAILARGTISVLASLLVTHAVALARSCWTTPVHERLQALLAQPITPSHGCAPVAAFDADGTLWSGDAYGAFAAVLVRQGLLSRADSGLS